MPNLDALAGQLAVCVDLGTACSGYVIKEPGMPTTETLDFNAPGKRTSLVKTPSDIAFELVRGRPKPGSAVISKRALKWATEEGPGVAHFSRYKMRLYDGAHRTSLSMQVSATNGSNHPLIAIFSVALGIIRAEVVRKITRMGYKPEEIHWIVTVPAMAADKQLAFMRHAIVEAGMVPTRDSPRLTLVAEPEAACAYMLTQPMMARLELGATVAVLDCGGGTHDFVALRILSRSPFRAEIVAEPVGGVGGATDINEAFYREMSRFVSCGREDAAFQHVPETVADLWAIAETAKRNLNNEPDGPMLFDLGFLTESECIEQGSFEERIRAFNEQAGYTVLERSRRGMRVQFAARFFRDLVLNAALPIEELARSFLARVRPDVVVVVGGFAESKLLRERLQAAAGARHLLVPPNPSTCVARGGISLMGAEIERMCRFTYGIEASTPWSSRFDVPGAVKKEYDADNVRCQNAFNKIIERGASVNAEWRRQGKTYFPAIKGQAAMVFRIFRSMEIDPVLTIDQEPIGRLIVDIDATTRKLPRLEQGFTVSWMWDNEIVMIVMRKSDGRQWRKRVDVE